jgi:uncharacterized protein (DUF362 family)
MSTFSHLKTSPAEAERRASTAAIVRARHCGYPAAPFDPPEAYPEFSRRTPSRFDPSNAVFSAVRESFRLLGLDAARFGSGEWNPLGDVVRPGESVVIKPNWVSHSCEHDPSWEQIITHGSVIRAVVDYVQLALGGRGTIALADGPLLNADFQTICRLTGADALEEMYAADGSVPLRLLDLREELFVTRGQVVHRRERLAGDPAGSVVVDLGERSEFYGFAGEGRYYGADYDTSEVNRHHAGKVHEYRLSGTAMQADVIIDVPKLKSHHKVGVTMALKGVVGLNCGRNWLPHRTQGTPAQGGDQFADESWRRRIEGRAVRALELASLRFPRVVPPMYRVLKAVGRRFFGATDATIRGGGWHGNDTLWRMVLDINRALTYADRSGVLHDAPQRRRFVVVDGIVAGEGFGPVDSEPLHAGVVLAGETPAIVDVVGAELMGFDHGRIPMLTHALAKHPLPLAESGAASIVIAGNVDGWRGGIETLRAADPFRFKAPLGWINYIERPSK